MSTVDTTTGTGAGTAAETGATPSRHDPTTPSASKRAVSAPNPDAEKVSGPGATPSGHHPTLPLASDGAPTSDDETTLGDEATLDGETSPGGECGQSEKSVVGRAAGAGAGDGPEGPAGPGTGARLAGLFRGGRKWVALALAVLLAAAVVCGIGWSSSSSTVTSLRQAAGLRTSAGKAARHAVIDLTTYSYKSLPKQQKALAAESTKGFQKNFAKSMKTLGTFFTLKKASANGTILNAAVKSATPTGAIVLVHVSQKASSTELKKPATQTSWLKVTLLRRHGVWLLDKVDLVTQ